MTTKLVDGILAMPKDKKLPLRWPHTKDLIPQRLQECYLRGDKWEFREPTEIITGVTREII